MVLHRSRRVVASAGRALDHHGCCDAVDEQPKSFLLYVAEHCQVKLCIAKLRQ